MSADNWAVCPTCGRKASNSRLEAEDNLKSRSKVREMSSKRIVFQYRCRVCQKVIYGSSMPSIENVGFLFAIYIESGAEKGIVQRPFLPPPLYSTHRCYTDSARGVTDLIGYEEENNDI